MVSSLPVSSAIINRLNIFFKCFLVKNLLNSKTFIYYLAYYLKYYKMATIRKWGDSLAVTITPTEAKQKSLKEGDEVVVKIYKKLDSRIFGMLPKKYKINANGQQAKDMLREEW